MRKELLTVLAVSSLALGFAGSPALAQGTIRVRGTIEKVEGNALMVKSRDGRELKVVPTDNALMVAIIKASTADIKQGSFVGVTGMPQADGSQRAIEVHIFPEAMRGTGEGHYAWDLRPQSTMTNANVEHAVTAVDGQTLTLKYKDGEKKIIVPPEAPVVTYTTGDKSDLKPGTKIFIAAAKKLPDGSLDAARINYGKDGLTPPM
jgi:outer membrane lipoprotein SlyB